jgi:DNA-binding PadR family transcriptional regulator
MPSLSRSSHSKRAVQQLVDDARTALTPKDAPIKTRDRIGQLQLDIMYELALTELLTAREIAKNLARTDESPVYTALKTLTRDGRLAPFVDSERSLAGSTVMVYALTVLGDFELEQHLIDTEDIQRLKIVSARRVLARKT